MADEALEYEVRVVGTEESAAQFEALNGAIKAQGQAVEDTGKAFDANAAFAEAAARAPQRQAAVAKQAEKEATKLQRALQEQITGWGALGTGIGQVGAVMGRVNPEFGRMGAAVGQAGQSVSAVATALAAPTPGSVVNALISVASTIVDAISAFRQYQAEATATEHRIRNMANEARSAIADIDDLTTAMERNASRRAQNARVEAGFGSVAEQEAYVVQAQKTRREIIAEQQIADDAARRLSREQGGYTREQRERIDAETAARSAAIAEIDAEIESRQELARLAREDANATIIDETAGAAEEDNRAQHRGAGAAAERAHAEAMAQQAREQVDIEREMNEEFARRAELQESLQRQLQDEIAVTAAIQEANEAKRLEAINEQKEQMRELFEKQKEGARATEEAFRNNAQEMEAFTQPIVSGLTRALSEVIAGAKTADQAFQGLLASFLEMIAQQTALQAAKEFAEAIAAFASQRYDEGALHLAAGAAYTAVAVAAGAGSIAVAPSAAAPASPEAGASDVGGGGGGTTVVNVNGPILSAGNSSGREELGAELGTIIREGNRRYGVAA